jgi:nucleoside phosphorylase
VLVCAATRTEARAATRGIARAATVPGAFEVLQTGMGPRAAADGLRRRLVDRARPAPSLVVSTGFAGSRARALGLGAVVVGTTVSREGGAALALRAELADALARAGVACAAARFVTTSEVVVGDAAGADEGEHAVDMESYAWAEVAGEHGLAAGVVRVITDTIEVPIPAAIVSLAGAGGAPGARRIVRGVGSALARPVELAGFVARVARFTGTLTACWARAAPAIARR